MTEQSAHEVIGSSPWGERRWHYRRSLASRVVLLTTMAVGLAVALVALGAYVTVRMSLESSLDKSLNDRADRASTSLVLSQLTSADIPEWVINASDVHIYFVDSSGRIGPVDATRQVNLPLGEPEFAVASGESSRSVRTVRMGTNDYRVA